MNRPAGNRLYLLRDQIGLNCRHGLNVQICLAKYLREFLDEGDETRFEVGVPGVNKIPGEVFYQNGWQPGSVRCLNANRRDITHYQPALALCQNFDCQ